MKQSKRMKAALEKVDRTKEYPLEEALQILKVGAKLKFDESVDIAVRLNIDPKKSDQMVRGAVPVPHGLGKKVRVLAFAKGEKAEEAKAAGADYVGAEDMAQKIQGGWLEFDVTVATPDMMKVIGRLGKILGTRGLMPNPKTGTVTMDIRKAVTELKAGKAVYRVDKAGNIHSCVGKISFDVPALADNVKTVLMAIAKARPASAKGTFLKKVCVTTTMGPSVKIDRAFLETA
jgi:large subunit ribosomal protein L1